MLVTGRGSTVWSPFHRQVVGRFVRQRSRLRRWVTPDGRPVPTGEGGFPALGGRKYLYVARVGRWASSTLMEYLVNG